MVTDRTNPRNSVRTAVVWDVVRSAAWKTAANTPSTEKLRPHFRDHLRFEGARYTRAR